MKAQIIIIVIFFTFQVSFLFAGGTNNRSHTSNIEIVTTSMNNLAPATPVEATFEDETTTSFEALDLSGLAPVTPVEARFDDISSMASEGLDLEGLLPVTPLEATFDDDSLIQIF